MVKYSAKLLHAAPNRGAALVTAIMFLGVAIAVSVAVVQGGMRMLQLSQSTLIRSDMTAIERSIMDNISCSATLGALPVACNNTAINLRGSDGAALTDAADTLGGYKLAAKCIPPTPADPNKRLVITASANRPDPLRPKSGPFQTQLFKRGATFAAPYPCVKYMNSGPTFTAQKVGPENFVVSPVNCSNGTQVHNVITMTCPAGYIAGPGIAICAFNNGGTPSGFLLSAFTGGNGTPLAENQATLDCCAPQVPGNNAYLVCIRN